MKKFFLFLLILIVLSSHVFAETTDYIVLKDLAFSTTVDANELVRLQNFNFNEYSFSCSDLNDLKILDKQTGIELKRIVEGTNTTQDGNIIFKTDSSLSGTYPDRFELWFNDSSCPTPNSFIFEDFSNQYDFDLDETGGSVSFVDLTTTSILKKSKSALKVTTLGSNNSSNYASATTKKQIDSTKQVGLWFYTTSTISNAIWLSFGGAKIYLNSGNLNILGYGTDYTIGSISPNTWYYLIVEKVNADYVNAWLYNDSGTLIGNQTNAKLNSLHRWTGDTVLLGARDGSAPITTYFDEMQNEETIVFPQEHVPTFSIIPGYKVGNIDLNIVKIDGYYFNKDLNFSYTKDGNLTITIYAKNSDGNAVFLDLEYVTSKTSSGSQIVSGLSLGVVETPTEFNVDWDISNVPNNSYYIKGKLYYSIGSQEYSDVNISDTYINIVNDANLLIKLPLDESTGNIIDTTKYTYSVKITTDENQATYRNLTTDVLLTVPIEQDVHIEIDLNSTDYYGRDYSLNLSSSQGSYTLQPVLPKNELSVTVYLYVVDSINQTPIANTKVIVKKASGSLSGQEISSGYTDSSGAIVFPLLLSEPYDIYFYKDNTFLYSAKIVPTSTTYTAKLDISTMAFVITYNEIDSVLVLFNPNKHYLVIEDGSVSFDVNVFSNTGIISLIKISVEQDNSSLYEIEESNKPNGNFFSITVNDVQPKKILQVYVEVTKTFSVTGETKTDSFTFTYYVDFATTIQKRNPLEVFSKFAEEYGYLTTHLIALIITILVLGFFAQKVTFNTEALLGIAIIVMGIFVYIGFVNVFLFVLGVLGGISAFIVFRGVG